MLDLVRGRRVFCLRGRLFGAADGGNGVEPDAVIELVVGEEVPQRRQVQLLAGCGEGVAVLIV